MQNEKSPSDGEEEIKKVEVPTEINEEIRQKAAKNIRFSFFTLIRNLLTFIKETMNLDAGTDMQGTIQGIKKDIDFKGYAVWILICSIFIASIGLYVNSAAVVIGAMLISPLMGPILGMGLSIGTNDWETLKRSLKGFGVAVIVALLTSFIFFTIIPLPESTPEILARTKPTFLDAFVAVFGGLAGIIAGSRSEKSNVIPGVAIATALMPPLCTAGYGLAIGDFRFFFGALYLFLMNSFFICFSTTVIVRLLKFPIKSFVDPIKERKVKTYIFIFAILIVIPSMWLFWGVAKESSFKRNASLFIKENVKYPGTEVGSIQLNYTDSVSSIKLGLLGNLVPQEVVESWKDKLKASDFSGVSLEVIQAKDLQSDLVEIEGKMLNMKSEMYKDFYQKSLNDLSSKDEKIRLLESELFRYRQDQIPFDQVSKELHIHYKDVIGFSFGSMVTDDFGHKDTIATIIVQRDSALVSELGRSSDKDLIDYLKVRLELDSIRLIDLLE
jgi:uncharacterized hydrophobic protein (TIGR00271 family)